MENKRIATSELDFDGIKQSLKTFLQGQEKFSDYDFEGSGLSVLLDVLAYNTHYNALYQNLAVNESFLDSASKRNSIISKAKELSYVPYSRRCATAYVNITVTLPVSSEVTVIELPKYTAFTATGENQTYAFYTTDTYIGYRSNNGRTVSIQNIEIKQGNPLQFRYVAGVDTKYIIPNLEVDTETLSVLVQDTLTSSTFKPFKRATNIVDIDNTSQVYFIKEIDNGYYQIEFGNDVIGKALTPGNVITLEYMSTKGPEANNISRFTYAGPSFASGQSVIVSSKGPSFGGSEPESIESIKYNAPHYYTAQNRCITNQDYRSMILSKFPEARHVNVWGGEDFKTLRDRKYGNVYISVVTKDGVNLTSVEKQNIVSDILKPRQAMSTHPVFVDPIFIKLKLDVQYKFDPTKALFPVGTISNNIVDNIIKYNNDYLFKFDSTFRYSKIISIVDNTDPSILNSNINIKMLYNIPVVFNKSSRYIATFFNPIFNYGVSKESILSSGIYTSESSQICYIDDVPDNSDIGKLRLFYYLNQQKVLVRYIGAINYITGELIIDLLNIVKSSSNFFIITALPLSHDIVSAYNHVVTIHTPSISVTSTNIHESNGVISNTIV